MSTIFIRAWLSIGNEQSACFIISYNENILLYGETLTSEISIEGKTEEVNLKV